MGKSLALEQILADLAGGDFQQRWEIVKQLPDFGTAAIAPLLDLLVDAEEANDETLQWFIIRSLGEYNHPEVMATLVDILMGASDPDLHDVAMTALAQFGEASIQSIASLLETPERRNQAVQVLACLHTVKVIPPLLSVVHDSDSEVRVKAVSALGQFRDPQIMSVLLAALGDSVAAVRREAVVALARDRALLQDPNGVARLGQCLWDSDLTVRQSAAAALGRLGGNIVLPYLESVLRSPQVPDSLRHSAIRSIGWIPQEGALTLLIATWENASEFVQLSIVEALGRFTQPLLQERAKQQLRSWLAESLASPNAQALKRALALMLGRWQDREAVSLLRQLLTDTDPQVQAHGAAALRLMGISPEAGIMTNLPIPLAALDTKSQSAIC
ncbi:MAG: HEAT repeat domain-containing protein [Leptolyngbyaceae cyanobacterium]